MFIVLQIKELTTPLGRATLPVESSAAYSMLPISTDLPHNVPGLCLISILHVAKDPPLWQRPKSLPLSPTTYVLIHTVPQTHTLFPHTPKVTRDLSLVY